MLKSKAQVLRRPKVPYEGVFCNYAHRVCMQNRLEGFDYCIKHILEDKNSPFKQCNYVSNKTGKRCTSAAPKADKKDGYCFEHARRTQLARQRASRKRRPLETPETLLEELEHYGGRSADDLHSHRRRPSLDNLASRVLDYASSSESESEQTLVEQAWRGDGDSDAESVDSEQEDQLKHAGVYTAEEVALITRDKLIRLQSLYIDQFKRLQYVMKEKRRKYLHSAKQERDTLGSIRAAKEDPEQREGYEELLALKRYHKRYGKEALMHRQSKERRIAMAEKDNYRPLSYPKCIKLVGGVKCSSRTVPLSKFCMDHVLEDSHQVLFSSCVYGLGKCSRPVLLHGSCCHYHSQLSEQARRFPLKEPEEPECTVTLSTVATSGGTEMEVGEVTVQADTDSSSSQVMSRSDSNSNTPVPMLALVPDELLSTEMQEMDH